MKSILFLILFFLTCSLQAGEPTPAQGKNRLLLDKNWQVLPSSKTTGTGITLSRAGFTEPGWYPASVPATPMAILMNTGVYPKDLLNSDHLKQVDRTRFSSSWWYKTSFRVPEAGKGKSAFLHFDGINYRASIWLNGTCLGRADSIYGAYRHFEFDVTGLLVTGVNFLAVEVFKPQPGEPTIGFVDWNPVPPDQNMGLWRPVYLTFSGPVRMKNPAILPAYSPENPTVSNLLLDVTLENTSGQPVDGTLTGALETGLFSLPVRLLPHEVRRLQLDSIRISAFRVKNPRLWWCNGLGQPELYTATVSFETPGGVSDSDSLTFGIRSVETYLTGDGHKGFKLNGKPVLILGGGWVDDLFLRDTPESNERQVLAAKDMNLNTIRLEGFWGTSRNLYDLCDRHGILLMAGWSCQWEWESYLGKACTDEFGGITSPEDVDLIARSFEDQVLWLRQHPSIFVWMAGSDKIPVPELEQKYREFLKTRDNRPYLISAGGGVSQLSGPSGVKMRGPYQFVGPNYWFEDSLRGGAFGFNTETGPGIQMPSAWSVRNMIPAGHRWPQDSVWLFHCNPSDVFKDFGLFNSALEGRFGKPAGFEDYLKKSQFLSWEITKPMFEAFRAGEPKTTGLIQWMLNSAWPSFYWQLLDYDGLPAPSYFAAKSALKPVQAVYTYKNREVVLVCSDLSGTGKLAAEITLVSFTGRVLLKNSLHAETGYRLPVRLMTVPEQNEPALLVTRLTRPDGTVASVNQTVIPVNPDLHDWEKSSWYHTPILSYSDYRSLNSLEPARVEMTVDRKESGIQIVTLKNQSTVPAFFLSLEALNETGEPVIPVFWEDNYFSLLPGESRQITCRTGSFKSRVSVHLTGWNCEPVGN